jgi:hypothetical protein
MAGTAGPARGGRRPSSRHRLRPYYDISGRGVKAGSYDPVNEADDEDYENVAAASVWTIHPLSWPDIRREIANWRVHLCAYTLLYLAMALASTATMLLNLSTFWGTQTEPPRCPRNRYPVRVHQTMNHCTIYLQIHPLV